MKKMFTVLVTAALFTTLAAPTYAACPQHTANLPNQNCPTAKCSVQNTLPENNQLPQLSQLSGKFCNWNTVLQNLTNQNGNQATCPTCNNQNPNCINGSCSDKNQANTNNSCNNQNQNKPCTNGNCNNQNQGVQKPDTTPDNGNNNQTTPTPPTEQDSGYAAQVVTLVNAERAKEGLAPLKADNTLTSAAQEIVSVFDHTRPNGSSCFTVLKEMGISYQGAGENIAYGQRTPEEVVAAWMKSPGHKANIMNKQFTTIGIGYHTIGNTAYWAQLFTY